MRRYDIDWVRVIAIGLLIIYHAAIAFQPWGTMIGFPTNKESWPALWLPMSLLNVWRIPLLFFVSGMGVYFAMQSRTPKELLLERAKRILVPYIFGIFVIVPIQLAIWRMKWMYVYNPGHLWFLGNIFVYVLIFTFPFYRLKLKHYSALIAILIFIAALVAEVLIIKPIPYELYAMTWHGFFLGMIAFFFGYVFMAAGIQYWKMIWPTAIVAIAFSSLRLTMGTPGYLLPIESVCWILVVLSLAHKYLNKGSDALKYLSEAAYPVYILHLVYQNLVSALIFPMDLAVPIKYVLLVVLTLAGCFITYELVKRTNVTRFLFGLKALRP
ncbi:MAG: acyltransferase family protein [Bacteroidota bacterium]